MKITNAVQIYKVIEARKKVSKMQLNATDFVKYINTINAINVCDEGETWFNGSELSKYQIVTFLKHFILPEKVALDSPTKYRNLRAFFEVDCESDYDEKGEVIRACTEPILNRNDFNDISQQLLTSLRLDAAQITPVTRNVSPLGTVVNRAVCVRGEAMLVATDSCMPILLTCTDMMKDYAYPCEVNEAIINSVIDTLAGKTFEEPTKPTQA